MSDFPLPDEMIRASGRQRRCLATREPMSSEGMIRFVIDPAGGLVADIDERLPGRGYWLQARSDVLKRAVARNQFAKAAKAQVDVPADLAERIEQALERRCLDLLGLARRAGEAVCGADKVQSVLDRGDAAVYVIASDAGDDAKRRAQGLARHIPTVAAFDRARLAAALGRQDAVHVALLPGGLAERFMRDAARLSGFRPRVLRVPEENSPAPSQE
ncbi:MAG: RNA-binding protein [Geminicoccaceae bacterium]